MVICRQHGRHQKHIKAEMQKDNYANFSDGVRFHEEIAHSWSNGYRRKSFNKRLSTFLAIFDRTVKAQQKWLDLGCGSGVLTRELLDREAIVTAVDGSPTMLDEVNMLQRDAPSLPLNCILSDVKDLNMIQDSYFDGVLCSSVIEYTENPQDVLEEIARVLRPGGVLILSTPPKWSALRTIQKLIRWLTKVLGKETYKYLSVSRFEIDPASLLKWFKNPGFSIVQVTPFDPLLPSFLAWFLRPSLLIIEARRL